jgi:hypothetical protein
MKKTSVIFISILFLIGCTATLPQKTELSRSYSLHGLKSYTLKLNSEKANVDPSFNKSFASSYCQMLEGSIKLSLQKTNPEFQYTNTNSDLHIDVTLEELHGGSAAARFWIGFGAGRTVSTVYVMVLKGQELMAESRITETTTLTDIIKGNYSNEDALMQDVPLLARKIAEFVNDPTKFKKENQP